MYHFVLYNTRSYLFLRLPELNDHLTRWGSLPVHLMGNLAALELGPDAVNLAGAARGALRISKALEEERLLDASTTSEVAEAAL